MRNFLLLMLGLIPVFALAQAQSEDHIITDRFFQLYQTNTDEAFDYLFSTNPWFDGSSAGVQNVKTQIRENVLGVMGEYAGYELIAERSLGNSLKIAIYLVKYDRQPLRFVFKFYKPADQWRIQDFRFTDNFDEDLEAMVEEELKKSE